MHINLSYYTTYMFLLKIRKITKRNKFSNTSNIVQQLCVRRIYQI